MPRLTRILARLSYVYIAIIAVSAASSALLPNFGDVAAPEAACYWRHVMFVYVDCGSELFASFARMLFFNFWQFFIYAPFVAFTEFLPDIIPGLIAGVISLALYAPIVFLIWRGIVWFTKRKTSRE